MNKWELVRKLYEVNAVKFGSFVLKSSIQSPIYIDLRVIISYPDILQAVANCMWKKVATYNFDLMCGVPYTALSIATVMAIKHNKPMVMKRKEIKGYGTKKILEGVFKEKQTCLVVEDLFTSGISSLETINSLEKAGLQVEHVVILIDREQGGVINIQKRGYFVHSVFTLTDIIKILCQSGAINQEIINVVTAYIRQNQVYF